jgi:uncharacterized protein (DUF4415 family)
MSKELKDELAALSKIPDAEIDLSDMPEQLDWDSAVVGKYYRPLKEPVSIRLDADVLHWFKSSGKGYQSRINEALREYRTNSLATAKNVASKPKTKTKRAAGKESSRTLIDKTGTRKARGKGLASKRAS